MYIKKKNYLAILFLGVLPIFSSNAEIDQEALVFINDMFEELKFSKTTTIQLKINGEKLEIGGIGGSTEYSVKMADLSPKVLYSKSNRLIPGRTSTLNQQTAVNIEFCSKQNKKLITRIKDNTKIKCARYYLGAPINDRNLPRIKKAFKYLALSGGSKEERF